MSTTIQNLESAFAGESSAHAKYLYFAKLARENGNVEVAEHFEHTAAQELKHAWGHLELIIGKPNVQDSLAMAIEGETYEYTYMYPEFEAMAKKEGNQLAEREMQEQTLESKQHAQEFAELLNKAQKRFAALRRVEAKHAEQYRQTLENLA
jgi:rubrerythrin